MAEYFSTSTIDDDDCERAAVDFLMEVADRLKEKANHYSPGEDPHRNFKVGRDILGFEHTWMAAYSYMAKHLAYLSVAFDDARKLDLDVAREVLGDIAAYSAIIVEIIEREIEEGVD